MFDTGLANRIRAKGVTVVEVAGWKTRGSSSYSPVGSVNHHTAGSSSGATPSLGVVTYGRSDLAGPLCNVLQSREPVGDDKAYVVAAGRANHAGQGIWKGVSGNSRFGGLEIEHVGTSGTSARRLEIAARIHAALLEAPGASRNAAYLAQHFEYATPAGRKIDFYNLSPHFTPASFRARVAYWIGRTTAVEDDDEMTPAQMSEIKQHIDGRLLQTLQYVTRRQPNTFTDPGKVAWLTDGATTTLKDLEQRLQSTHTGMIAKSDADPSGAVWLVDRDAGTKLHLSSWEAVDVAVFLGANIRGNRNPHVLPAAYMNDLSEIA